jgi:hypothetical protein
MEKDYKMPFFKTTKNIFVDHGEYFDSNWMNSDELILPPQKKWTYDREMTIDDVDLWELIYEGKFGVYAAWSPYAEFYLMRPTWELQVGSNHPIVETYYGPNAAKKVYDRCKELGVTLPLVKHWVESDELWLHN